MKKVAALAALLFCFSLGYVTPAFSAWTSWWTYPWFTDYTHPQTDFPTTRPIYFRVFYQSGEISETYVDSDYYHEGIEGGDWELVIDGNYFSYYETDPVWFFNRIDFAYPPEPVDSITVPVNRPSGQYTVSWDASPTSGVTYTLEEASDSSFTSGLRTVVSGTTDLSAQISERTDGLTYYYRVRAEDGDGLLSVWVQGANGCRISPWTPWWSQSGWAKCLERWDFPTTRPIYLQVTHKNSDPSEWYVDTSYFVDVDEGLEIDGDHFSYCTDNLNKRFNQIDVAYPPGLPGSISVPASSATGDYTVSWGASQTSGVTYTLEEDTDSSFTSLNLRTVVSGTTALSYQLAGRTENTTYYYRVRADEEGGYSSDWVTGANGCYVSGAGWTTWWTYPWFTDYTHPQTDFPTTRPIYFRVYYQSGEIIDTYVDTDYYHDGEEGGDWELVIDGNNFSYYETDPNWFFNRIDIKYGN